MRTLAEDLFVGVKDDRGAAAVRRRADLFQLGLRCAARIMLAPQLAVAGDLDHQPVGQRVDHRDADAVQAAGGGIDLGGKLAAGMQRGEDHLQRRLVLRSEENTSELQSLMRISYAVFCLKKKKNTH